MFNKTKTTTILGILVLFVVAETSLNADPQKVIIADPQGVRTISPQGGNRQYRTNFRRPGSTSIFNILLRDEDVQKDLEITEDQKKKLQELSKQATLPFDDYLKNLSAAKNDEEKAKIREDRKVQSAALKKQKEAEASELLTPDQRDKLDKVFVEKGGLGALQQVSIQTKLKLSEDQIASLEKITKERGEAQRKLGFRASRKEREKFEKDWDAKTFQVLETDQQKHWVSLGGKSPDAKSDTPVVENKSESSKDADSEEEKSTEKRTVRIPNKVVGDGTVVASFAPSNKKMKDTAFGKPATSRRSSQQRNRRQRDDFTSFNAPKISFNFANAPWETVLKYFAKQTDLTLVAPEVPKENFNYLDSHQYTPTEALDILNGYLIQKGFVLLRKNRFLYVHNLDENIPANMIPDVTPEQLYFRGKHEFVRVTVKLSSGVDVTKMAQEIENHQDDPGTTVGIQSSHHIVVTDMAGNVQRIMALIPIDEPGPNELLFKYFKLRYISVDVAEELVSSQLGLTNGVRNVSGTGSNNSSRSNRSSRRSSDEDRRRLMRDMFSRMRDRGGRGSRDRENTSFQISTSGTRRGGTTTTSRTTPTNTSSQNTNAGKEKVTADRRNNALLVTCTASTMKRIEEIIEQIDISNPQGPKGDRGTPYLVVYKVTRSNIMETTKTLDAIMPGIVVNEDGNFKTLSVVATAEQHRRVQEIIDRLEGSGPGGVKIALISVGRMDPVAVANTLKRTFEAEGDGAPSIEADARGRRLLVRGTESHLAQIEKVVTDMLENQRPNGVGKMRIWDASGRNPEFFQMLNNIWGPQNPGQPLQFNVAPTQGPIHERLVPSDDKFGPGLRIPGYDTPTQRPLQNTFRPAKAPTKSANKPKRVEKDTATVDDNSIVQTSYLDDEKKSTKDEKKSNKEPSPVKPEDSKPKTETSKFESQKKNNKEVPITITRMPNGQLLIQHPDPEVLNRFEEVMNALAEAIPVNNGWTVFYLRSADATTTAELLGKIFSGANVEETSATSSGSIFGNFFSRLGNQVADATGLQDANNLIILPDVRTNSLLVKGPPAKIAEVRQVLNVLDVSEVPASLKDRFPRSIPVKYADVNQIADNLRELYKDYLEPEGSNGGSQNAMLQMLTGGGRNRRSRGGNGNNQSNKIRLAISVDTRMGDLLVSANDSLFTEIETWVKNRDEAARSGKYQSQVIQPLYTDPEKIQQSLSQLSSKIQTESMVSGSTRSGSNNRFGGSRSDRSSSDARRRMFEQMMRGGSSRGGFGRGGSSDRSRGRSTFAFGGDGRIRTLEFSSRGGSTRGSSRGGSSRGGRSRGGRGR